MIPVHLTSIKTRDGIVLEGIAVLPRRKSKTALIWLHGLSSRFSSGQRMVAEISSACRTAGIGYFKFNTRGHDIASRADDTMIGAGFERFEDCIYDIRAMIRFAKTMGYKKIILAGHSTGANKALYYCYKTKDTSIKGLMLLGPISDVAAKVKEIGTTEIKRAIRIAKNLYKRNPQSLMPLAYGLMTAERFLSLYKAESAEDVFAYHNPLASWKELKSIRMPLAVIIGSIDQYRDRPVTDIIEAFRNHADLTKRFTSITIKGANHGFQRKEKELADVITAWIKKEIR